MSRKENRYWWSWFSFVYYSYVVGMSKEKWFDMYVTKLRIFEYSSNLFLSFFETAKTGQRQLLEKKILHNISEIRNFCHISNNFSFDMPTTLKGYWENHVLLCISFLLNWKQKNLNSAWQCFAFTPSVKFESKFKCWQHRILTKFHQGLFTQCTEVSKPYVGCRLGIWL